MMAAVDSDAAKFSMLWFDLSCAPPASFVDVAVVEDVEDVEVETPYGRPSAPLTVGEIGDRRVAFLPRHGRDHELPPHAIPYRANVWAMKELGVRRIIGPNASGALKAELELGVDGVEAPVLELVGPQLGSEPDTASLVAAHVHDDPTLGGHPLHRPLELGPAVAPLRPERVAGQALGVHADQRGAIGDAARADERGARPDLFARPIRRRDGPAR